VVVGEAGVKGKGVFARCDFARGEFIFRRRHGQVVRNSDIPSLSEEDQRRLCELDFKTSAVLLPPGCYLNHSCDPNAMRSGVNVYAWREIHASEEITIDYRLNAHDGERSAGRATVARRTARATSPATSSRLTPSSSAPICPTRRPSSARNTAVAPASSATREIG
jgi:SET domain-containing protein